MHEGKNAVPGVEALENEPQATKFGVFEYKQE